MSQLETLRKERMELATEAKGITDAARGAVRSLTDGEKGRLDDILARTQNIDNEVKGIEADQARLANLGSVFGSSDEPSVSAFEKSAEVKEEQAATAGEHFVKAMQKAGLKGLKRGQEFSAPEFKAATDTQVTGGPTGFYEPWLVDRQLSGGVHALRTQPTVVDLISWGTTNSQMIEYLQYPATLLEGSAGFVNEGGTKPQVHLGTPTWVQDPMREVAAWFKITDDMAEDLPFVVTEINNELKYNFAMVEENAILNGDGTAPNLLGIMKRSGVQHLAGGTTPASLADQLFKALQMVHTATGFAADGIVINPTDYQNLRLMKDVNGQYFAGGIFGTNYGQNGLAWEVPLWGVRTIVSNVAPVGKPIVGAWRQSATGLRKGGLKVESTNSHVDDFTNDRITIRMREKIGLQVKYPAGFVSLDLAAV